MPQIVVGDIDRSVVKDLTGVKPIKKDPNKEYVYARRDRIGLKESEGFKVVNDNPQSDVVLMAKEKTAVQNSIKKVKGK